MELWDQARYSAQSLAPRECGEVDGMAGEALEGAWNIPASFSKARPPGARRT